MIEKIEAYDNILKVSLKPTRKFPNGFFFCDADALDLVQSYSWHLREVGNNIYVSAIKRGSQFYFQQEYAFQVLGYYPDNIDFRNLAGIDCRDINLNAIPKKETYKNRPCIGYRYYSTLKNKFQVTVFDDYKFLDEVYCPNEFEAIKTAYNMRQFYYKDFNYDFFEDRQHDFDILNAELTKKISSDYATYLHIVRYVNDNPWYVYRFGLEGYCKDNHISAPTFRIDSNGFMVHPITGQKFCPYKKG